MYEHIHYEEDKARFASLFEKYPWTRHYYSFGGAFIEEPIGCFDPAFAMGSYPGWSKLFEKLCAQIQEVMDKYEIPSEQFVIRQVKEKFAKIRLYWDFCEIGENGEPTELIGRNGMVIDFLGSGTSISGLGGQSAQDAGYDEKYDLARVEIRQILKDIADESYVTCILCGSTDEIGYTQGWVLPICGKCGEAGLENRRSLREIFETEEDKTTKRKVFSLLRNKQILKNKSNGDERNDSDNQD